MYSHPEWEYGATWSAAIYTMGSIGVFMSDIMEFYSVAHPQMLKLMVWWSVVGSLMYVFGSIGFFPEVYNQTPMLGIWGFLLGSFFVGCSHYWKAFQIGVNKCDRFQISKLYTEFDTLVDFGAELSAGLGGSCFFIGMAMYLCSTLQDDFEGPWNLATFYIWNAGSYLFLSRSHLLGYRYWKLRSERA